MTARPTTPLHPDCSPGSHWQERLVLPGVELYLGDCLEMPWIDADAVVSDPPYGIAYCHGARKGGRKMGTDGMAIIGDDKPFDPRPWLGYPKVCLWGANHYANRLPNSSAWLVWDKREGINPNDQADGETAWTNMGGVLRLKSRYWNGAQAKEKDEPRIHSNQKPVSLMAWCMDVLKLPEGAVVLDPYMGSGSTIIAAIRTGRKAIGIEKDPEHFRRAAERIRAELAHDLFHVQNSVLMHGSANQNPDGTET